MCFFKKKIGGKHTFFMVKDPNQKLLESKYSAKRVSPAPLAMELVSY